MPGKEVNRQRFKSAILTWDGEGTSSRCVMMCEGRGFWAIWGGFLLCWPTDRTWGNDSQLSSDQNPG